MSNKATFVAATFVITFVGACRASEDGLYDTIFTCDPGASDSCGTTRDNRPMQCFPGKQLGGEDFCAESCNPVEPPGDPARFLCTSSGALLRRCKPTAGQTNPDVACPPDLECYRTDLLVDDGICLMMRVCADDSDCTGDPRRSRCAGTLIRERFSSVLASDHLQCVQPTCKTSSTACLSGESCLAAIFDTALGVPDVCVPNCDSELHCPPNFACSRSPAAPASPRVCVPGLPGARCTASEDCIAGDCVATGAGFSVCTFPCRADPDCAPLNMPANSFVCVEGVPGGGRHCVSTTPFQGAYCMTTDDCPQGEECIRFSPYVPVAPTGECRVPCGGGTCPARGGVPHVCLAGGEGGCYPGTFGLPCADSSGCISGLSCAAISQDVRVADATTICTTECLTDGDCDANPWTTSSGFCQDGLCHLAGWTGAPCARDAECFTRYCGLDQTGNGICLDPTRG